MNPRYTPGASADLNDLLDWYEAQQAGLGAGVADDVDESVRRVVAQPHGYPCVPRAPAGREIRVTRTDRFQVVIVYEVTATEPVILSVTHARSARRPWRRQL